MMECYACKEKETNLYKESEVPKIQKGTKKKQAAAPKPDTPTTSSGKKLLQCELCFITVHFECYGSSTFFEKGFNQANLGPQAWICDRCMLSINQYNEQHHSDVSAIKCKICSGTGGLMKAVD